jgi:hypothetical protein
VQFQFLFKLSPFVSDADHAAFLFQPMAVTFVKGLGHDFPLLDLVKSG